MVLKGCGNIVQKLRMNSGITCQYLSTHLPITLRTEQIVCTSTPFFRSVVPYFPPLFSTRNISISYPLHWQFSTFSTVPTITPTKENLKKGL